MHPLLRSPRVALALACASVAGCGDLSTAPDSFVREADGAVWVAVSEPVGLPSARTWLAALPASSPAVASVRGRLEAAASDRRAGRLEAAIAGENAAAREAVDALSTAPDERVVRESVAAAAEWTERAAGRTAGGAFGELAVTEGAVRAAVGRSRELLAAGDTLAAMREVATAAEAARAWSPLEVVVRVLARAEARIDAEAHLSPNLARARHLLRGARDGLAAGDHSRAFQRAVYALQLIEQERRDGR
ncbi:MAG TPA: hypothetical protein VF625_14890 [Longimicrobium sp.]